MQIDITEKEAIALFNIYHLMERTYIADELFVDSISDDVDLLEGIIEKIEKYIKTMKSD